MQINLHSLFNLYGKFFARYKDGKQLSSSKRIKITDQDDVYKLIINNVEEKDLGMYESRASNKKGNMGSFAQLIITGEDRVLIQWFSNNLL